jgi:hypothetical protein
MSGGDSLVFMGAAVVVGFVGVPAVMMFMVERNLPWGISRRLRRGKKVITQRTRYTNGSWNPAKQLGPRNFTPLEPGWAFYALNADGMVELELVRPDGRREYYTGPPVDPPQGHNRARLAGLLPILTYAVAIGSGFTLGFAAGSGSASHRSGAGALGAILGLSLAWLALTIATATLPRRLDTTRGAARRTSKDPSE